MGNPKHRVVRVTEENATSIDALILIDELSAVLDAAYGASGRSGFDPSVDHDAIFLVARDGPELLGCGALKPMAGEIAVAEVKRMYARPGTSGVGRSILAALESAAVAEGYRALWLETRRANDRAVRFYTRAGFVERAPYGKYIDRPEAICMEKLLFPDTE